VLQLTSSNLYDKSILPHGGLIGFYNLVDVFEYL